MNNNQYIKRDIYLENTFLFESAERNDVKGKRYFENTKKYYCIDVRSQKCQMYDDKR